MEFIIDFIIKPIFEVFLEYVYFLPKKLFFKNCNNKKCKFLYHLFGIVFILLLIFLFYLLLFFITWIFKK